jgi:glutathione peroxidase
VLAFPCNQFGAQEPGTDDEILEFATSKFGVTFPMFSKIDVNGPDACELYRWLRGETGGADITWNFEKFLVGRDGTVIERLSPMVTPEEIQARMSELL